MREFEVAKLAASAGCEVVKRYFRDGFELRNKAQCNLVTDADVASEKAIVEVIKESFPDHSVLGEETYKDDANAEHLWVIDPIDGTNNFAHAVPHFGISVGYYRGGVAQCGVIVNPARDDWYIASKGQGAFCNDKQVHVSAANQLSEVLIGVGFYYDRGVMMQNTLDTVKELFEQQIHGIRRFGTASLDLAMVGMGMFGAFFEYELSPWDFAAGRLFVEEAGGKITTCTGDDLPLAKTTVLASNGKLHEQMLEIVSRRANSN
ncbi:MAG: myo-inositol-1(or 4)-monophosphatase [Pirellulaceae bacterium]|jgi:myo-inositol-1(or 4)-monophosphatase